MTPDQGENTYRLDPKDFPKRLELELSDEVLEGIQRIAERTGRSVAEVITDIISRAISEQ